MTHSYSADAWQEYVAALEARAQEIADVIEEESGRFWNAHATADETSPWQENAIRCLEEGR